MIKGNRELSQDARVNGYDKRVIEEEDKRGKDGCLAGPSESGESVGERAAVARIVNYTGQIERNSCSDDAALTTLRSCDDQR